MRSACPACRAYSSIMWMSTHRTLKRSSWKGSRATSVPKLVVPARIRRDCSHALACRSRSWSGLSSAARQFLTDYVFDEPSAFDLSAQDRTIVVEELFHPLSLVRGFGRFGWWATHGHVSLSSVGAFRPMSKTLPSGSFSVVHSMPNSANDAIFSAPSDTARSTSAG